MGQPEHRQDDLPQLRDRRGVPRIRLVGAGLDAGTVIEGFRIERPLGGGEAGFVYEATQLSLGRRVALRVIGPERLADQELRVRLDRDRLRAAALHHPNLLTPYATGEWEGGRFVATRLVRGATLADLLERGAPVAPPALDAIAAALAAAHAAGLAHGRVCEHNIFVEAGGTAQLADLGLGRGVSAADDHRALAEVRSRLTDVQARRRRRTRVRGLAAMSVVIAAGMGVLALAGGREDSALEAAPPMLTAGTTPLGSNLAPGEVDSRGCSASPSANTSACTFSQSGVFVRRSGVLRGWAVRGATGDVALQVIRGHGRQAHTAGFAQPQRIDDAEPHSFDTELRVRTGDRVGIRLGPGARIGVREDRERSPILQWDGGLTTTPQAVDARSDGLELLLRADVDYGAQASGPRQLSGAAARTAPRGRRLGSTGVVIPGGGTARVAAVAVAGGISLDLLRGARLARLEVPDADPAGDFLGFSHGCGPSGAAGFCMRWSNPDTTLPLQHEYEVRANGTIRLVG